VRPSSRSIRLPSSVTVSCFAYCAGDHPDLHSFPTRRSSDLAVADLGSERPHHLLRLAHAVTGRSHGPLHHRAGQDEQTFIEFGRSEEHTSELQSRENLVCRLLLEKKNPKNDKTRNMQPAKSH